MNTFIFSKEEIKASKIAQQQEQKFKTRNVKDTVILNCPFCGEKAVHKERFERHSIECVKCGIQTQIRNSKEDVIKLWNNRTKEGDLNAK